MPKYLNSLSDVISLMDFVTEISTLYRVEPGPEFRLVASNTTAQVLGAGSKNLHGKLLKDFVPKEYYIKDVLPFFERVVGTKTVCRFQAAPPFPVSIDSMDFLLTPVMENEECTHIWVISKYRQSKEELEYIAFHDVLTGLPNRRFFLNRLNKSISRYQQHKMKFAVMMLDCDNFKQINDSFGHGIGDEMLKEVAGRLKNCIREVDFLARLGGDEFVILLEDWQTEETVIEIANRILDELQQPAHIKEHILNNTSSIGISVFNKEKEVNVESIISFSDKALYEAKSKGRNNYVILNMQ